MNKQKDHKNPLERDNRGLQWSKKSMGATLYMQRMGQGLKLQQTASDTTAPAVESQLSQMLSRCRDTLHS